MNMNANKIDAVENDPAENNNILDSNSDFETGPITTKKRRRIIVREVLDDCQDTRTMADWITGNLFIDGAHTQTSCPSYRQIYAMCNRYRNGDLYCTNYMEESGSCKLLATGSQRVRGLLDIKAPNGDLSHTRDHLHWSLLTARPCFWDSLMRLINQKCPGMYTPADKPLISSFKFGMPRSLNNTQLKQLFPCMSSFIGEYDGTKNYWLDKCPRCRNRCLRLQRGLRAYMDEQISWYKQTVIPELHARDVAMKWAYLGRRLVYEI